MVSGHVSRLAALVLAAVLAATSPAAAIIIWEASGGWNFGGTNSFGGLTQPSTPPAIVTSVGDFSNNGALCPALGTPNYICGYYYGETNLAGTPGGLVTLRASARLRQQNATGTGFGKIVYAGARVYFYQVGYGAVVSPVAQAVFNFGLSGTRFESTNNGQATVVAKGIASLNADRQRFIQCFADVCEPVVVPISGNWDPGAPNGTAFIVDLRTDASITAPSGVTFDAEAIADYRDTLVLHSIELQDANGEPVPGAQLVVKDAQGQPVYTIPNTPPPAATTTTTTLSAGTTTTLPASTTTTTTTTTSGPDPTVTTTTLAASMTTTTTGQTPTVTTTTLPASCATGATFASIACRLARLRDTVLSTAEDPVGTKLAAKLAAAERAVATAEAIGPTSRARSAKALGKALQALAAYRKLLASPPGKRALDKDERATLAEPLEALRADLRTLRKP